MEVEPTRVLTLRRNACRWRSWATPLPRPSALRSPRPSPRPPRARAPSLAPSAGASSAVYRRIARWRLVKDRPQRKLYRTARVRGRRGSGQRGAAARRRARASRIGIAPPPSVPNTARQHGQHTH
eukprot:5675004-Pyramimonas_sp.AAC.1